jgi:hypothetical protein
MAIQKKDDNAIIDGLRDLSPATQGTLMIAAGGAVWALRRAARMLVRRALTAGADSTAIQTVRGKAEPLHAGRVRIGRRVFRQMPDGTRFEEGVEYTVEYVGNEPMIISVRLED